MLVFQRRSGLESIIRAGKVVKIVTQIDNINENGTIQIRKRQDSSPGTGFQSSLESMLSQKGAEKTENGKTAALSEPQPPHFNRPFAASADDIVCQTDSLLDMLESYANSLENPGTTLKDLASLVDRIKDGAANLMASAEKGTSEGSELSKIAAQTSLAANIEYIKFQRGDYL
jgi:methyl-accepting chemotaxis protein